MPETRSQKAERIADLMVDLTRRNGICSDADLIKAGFTAEEIADLRPLATGFASITLSKRTVNH